MPTPKCFSSHDNRHDLQTTGEYFGTVGFMFQSSELRNHFSSNLHLFALVQERPNDSVNNQFTRPFFPSISKPTIEGVHWLGTYKLQIYNPSG